VRDQPIIRDNNIDIEEDSKFLEKQEQFEETYNHRYLEPGSESIITYPRKIPSERDDPRGERRREKKKSKKENVEKNKQTKREQLEVIKKEKKKEILEKMKEIKDLTGNDALDMDLDTEFDTNAFEKALTSMYAEDEEGKSETSSKILALREGLDRTLEEYYNLDFEDLIGGEIPTRFKYEQVAANDFGMSVEEILTTPEYQLNARVPMRSVLAKQGNGNLKLKRNFHKRSSTTNGNQTKKIWRKPNRRGGSKISK